MTDPVRGEFGPDEVIGDGDTTPEAIRDPYGVGPFSVREVALLGVWFVAFVVSFFPVATGSGASVWLSGLSWILTVGVPTAAAFLIVLRRLSPEGIRRVGSLGIDQFASVAFTVSAVIWLGSVWDTVAVAAAGGPWLRTWVIWVELVAALAGVVLTVFAPLIPVLREDFRHRPEVLAHPSARPMRPVRPRPARPRPARPGSAATSPDAGEPTVVAPVAAGDAPPDVFWALVPEERDVLDDRGVPLFVVGPTAWALVIEDRDGVFLIRHEDGRVGFLHDTADVTRG